MNVVAKFKRFINIFKKDNYVSIKRVKTLPKNWSCNTQDKSFVDPVSPITRK